MENVKILQWLSDNSSGSGYGSGYGDGSGHGSGEGYGEGYGSGFGSEFGYGDGSGDGSGSGSGSGYGYGYGSGYGSGDGSGSGSGSGYGSGSGDGSGDGSGYGYGYGYGYGDGYGSGYGSGSGYGYGSGYGSGYGDGSGSGSGYGDGSGSGSGIRSFKGYTVYDIDGVNTIFRRLRETFATGFILNSDFTTEECYVVKGNGYFAHGKTLREATEALRSKIFENMDSEEAINKFLEVFDLDKKYPGTDFFEWHHYLTGSCLMGRESFVKNHGLNIHALYSVSEFIEICENDYGAEVIQQLKERIKEHEYS